eukprot:6466782-Amphidinium_carterae.2
MQQEQRKRKVREKGQDRYTEQSTPEERKEVLHHTRHTAAKAEENLVHDHTMSKEKERDHTTTQDHTDHGNNTYGRPSPGRYTKGKSKSKGKPKGRYDSNYPQQQEKGKGTKGKGKGTNIVCYFCVDDLVTLETHVGGKVLLTT